MTEPSSPFLPGTAIVVMGVSGSGKSTLGAALAAALPGSFLDADDVCPPACREKMTRGVPLDDADRQPWLDDINLRIRAATARHRWVVLACSAHKAAYRARLAAGLTGTRWIHLRGDYELIHARMQARRGHFMPPTLLASQFAILEPPADALSLDVRQPPDELLARALAWL